MPLPANVQPPLAQARDDYEALWRDGCFTQYTGVEPRVCTYGTSATATIALVGDSHAAHWFPALWAIAREHGWKVVTYVKFGCPFADMPTGSLILKRRYTECEAWRLRVLDDLAVLRPDLTLVGMSRWIIPADTGPTDPVAQGDAIGRLLSRISGRVGLIVDNPVANIDVPACLAANVNDIRACAYPRSYAFGFDFLVRERQASRVSGARLIDLASSICPGRSACPAVVNGYIVFRDSHHLTASFAASLAPEFEAALVQDGLLPPTALGGSRSGG